MHNQPVSSDPEPRWVRLAARWWPQLRQMPPGVRAEGALLVWAALYGVTLAVPSLLWLIVRSLPLSADLAWWSLLLFFLLRLILGWFDFTAILNGDDGYSGSAQGRLITWSAALLIGPPALWLDVIALTLTALYARRWQPRFGRIYQNWRLASHLSLKIGRDILAGLSALAAYRAFGGALPLPNLTYDALLPALLATAVYIGLTLVVVLPLFVGRAVTISRGGSLSLLIQNLRFLRAALLVYVLPAPAGVLLAGLYVQNGPGVYLIFAAGVTLLTAFAHQLGDRAVRAQHQAFENSQLEALARALLSESAGGPELPRILGQYVPTIFGPMGAEVRLFPEQVLFSADPLRYPIASTVWERVQTGLSDPLIIRADPDHAAPADLIVAPITAFDDGRALGAIALHVPVGSGYLTDWLPVLNTLSNQVAAYLYRSQAYQEILDSLTKAYREEFVAQAYETEYKLTYQRLAQESAIAGRIQATFLPKSLPDVPGWQFSMALDPARETSGDFYDCIPLKNGYWGLVVADVADKGMGAALFMALARTLIRTFAPVYPLEPAQVLRAANQRILSDTDSDLFVTVFYAVLDPVSGVLYYCNAGHNPPLLLITGQEVTPLRLTRTAIPLGIKEYEQWEQGAVTVPPGAILTLYTDGITEAHDEEETMFGEERLVKVLQANRNKSAAIIEDKILSAVYNFAGGAPQSDDITLMVVIREQEK